jgi:hypothetical protein
VPPSIVWGIGVGLAIAAIDTLRLVLKDMPSTSQWPIDDVNLMANVVLYSLIGFRVGRLTGIVRDAAESGVIAGVVVGLLGIAVSLVVHPQAEAITSVNTMIGMMAINVAMGGVLSIVTGWLGKRAGQDQSMSRR